MTEAEQRMWQGILDGDCGEVVEALAEGADPTKPDACGVKPLELALRVRNVEVFQVLRRAAEEQVPCFRG